MNFCFKGVNFTKGFRPGNVAASFVLVASTLFANASMAIPVDYTFTGSNGPLQSGEDSGTINGTFTLDDASFGGTQTGTDYSIMFNHTAGTGFTQTFTTANTSLFDFSVTTDGSGVVSSLTFDGDVASLFLDLKWDIEKDANRLGGDDGNSNLFNYNNGSTGRVFLDNFTVSQAVAAVPEPSIIVLFGLGLVGLGFARRRRQA